MLSSLRNKKKDAIIAKNFYNFENKEPGTQMPPIHVEN